MAANFSNLSIWSICPSGDSGMLELFRVSFDFRASDVFCLHDIWFDKLRLLDWLWNELEEKRSIITQLLLTKWIITFDSLLWLQTISTRYKYRLVYLLHGLPIPTKEIWSNSISIQKLFAFFEQIGRCFYVISCLWYAKWSQWLPIELRYIVEKFCGLCVAGRRFGPSIGLITAVRWWRCRRRRIITITAIDPLFAKRWFADWARVDFWCAVGIVDQTFERN